MMNFMAWACCRVSKGRVREGLLELKKYYLKLDNNLKALIQKKLLSEGVSRKEFESQIETFLFLERANFLECNKEDALFNHNGTEFSLLFINQLRISCSRDQDIYSDSYKLTRLEETHFTNENYNPIESIELEVEFHRDSPTKLKNVKFTTVQLQSLTSIFEDFGIDYKDFYERMDMLSYSNELLAKWSLNFKLEISNVKNEPVIFRLNFHNVRAGTSAYKKRVSRRILQETSKDEKGKLDSRKFKSMLEIFERFHNHLLDTNISFKEILNYRGDVKIILPDVFFYKNDWKMLLIFLRDLQGYKTEFEFNEYNYYKKRGERRSSENRPWIFDPHNFDRDEILNDALLVNEKLIFLAFEKNFEFNDDIELGFTSYCLIFYYQFRKETLEWRYRGGYLSY